MADLTIEERIAARKAKEDDLRERLAAMQFDGPHDFSRSWDAGSMLAGVLGVGRDRFAICLRCGSIVVLNDPEERPDGTAIERGVRIHLEWHEGLR